MVFDNEKRNRYYGIRVGDIVEIDMFNYAPNLKGEVVEYSMDNNRVYVLLEGHDLPSPQVAEHCIIITKVEDRNE